MKTSEFRSQQGMAPIIIAFVVAAIIAVGGGAFYFIRNAPSSPSAAESSDSAAAPSAPQKEELRSTIPGVVQQGQNLECDWRLPNTTADSPFNTGKLYTSGQKGRSMISGSVGEGMTMEGNAIYDGAQVFTWITMGNQTFGQLFTPEKLAELDSGMTPQERQQAEQIRSEMIFTCKEWTPDETMFVVPSDIEFK